MITSKRKYLKLIIVEIVVAAVFLASHAWLKSLILCIFCCLAHGVFATLFFKKILMPHLTFILANSIFFSIWYYVVIGDGTFLMPDPTVLGIISISVIVSILISVISLVPAIIVKILFVILSFFKSQ